DKQDLFDTFSKNGFQVAKTREEMIAIDIAEKNAPILGVFNENGLPFALDRENEVELKKATPSLAEMTSTAIRHLNRNQKGVILQEEGGKVDWSAHSNDIGALLYDQLAFDEAVAIAIAFAEEDGETLVIITTDHGNANPGLFSANNFDQIIGFKHTNDWVLQGINRDFTAGQVIERIEYAQGIVIKPDEAIQLLSHYVTERGEDGLYNPYKLPFSDLAKIQQQHTN